MTEHIDRLPTVEEILAGETQGGVPRPAFLRDAADDGTVQRAASASVVPAPAPAPLSRWQAFKRRLRSLWKGFDHE